MLHSKTQDKALLPRSSMRPGSHWLYTGKAPTDGQFSALELAIQPNGSSNMNDGRCMEMSHLRWTQPGGLFPSLRRYPATGRHRMVLWQRMSHYKTDRLLGLPCTRQTSKSSFEHERGSG